MVCGARMRYRGGMRMMPGFRRLSLGACCLAALSACSTEATQTGGTDTAAVSDSLSGGATGEPTVGQTGEAPTTGEGGTSAASGSSGSSDTTTGALTTGDTTTEPPDPLTTTDPGTTTEADTTDSTTGDGSTSGSSSGTAGDDDADGDGIPDADDNCPDVFNPNQDDNDGDGAGDACDDDDDNDGIPDADDNCKLTPNPGQENGDGDAFGDACDPDFDNDGIPNPDDPFPNDGNLPGKAKDFKIYAHSASQLYTVDVSEPYTVASVSTFKFAVDSCNHQMTDVAIDRYGVLYGVTFDCGYVINPETAQAYKLGTLPQQFNGLTLIPKGILDPNKDVLVGIALSGAWYRMNLVNGQFQLQQIGSYGPQYTSAGDAFSIEGVGTYAAVNKAGVGNATVIVEVNPANGNVMTELATLQGYPTVYGLAGWQGLILAFDQNGQMIRVDPMTKAVTPLGNKGVAWWGAGVGTVIPQ